MNEEQEFIHEASDEVEQPKKPPTLLEMLQYELRQHMEIALKYKKKIEEAKTQYKKDYYNKKLQKNNIQATKVLTAIERYTLQKAIVYENPKEEKENESTESTEVSK